MPWIGSSRSSTGSCIGWPSAISGGSGPATRSSRRAIVNEAYMRLIGRQGADWQNRAHFFAVAAQSMRRILVEHARRRDAKKRGGEGSRYLLDTVVMTEPRAVDLIALDDALAKLTALDAEQGRVVELRFFGGLTEDETAEVLSVSSRTVHRKWLAAKTFLHRELSGSSR